MRSDGDGCHDAFALFVPASSVAKLIGRNPFESVDDAVLQTVARNSRTFVWRDERLDSEWRGDGIDPAVAGASVADLAQTAIESGLQREQALVRGLAAHLDDTVRDVRALNSALPGCTTLGYDIGTVVQDLSDDRAAAIARTLGVATSDAARSGTGSAGVKAAVAEHAEAVRSRHVKIERALGPRAPGKSIEEDLRVEIAASDETTHDGAIAAVAEKFGTTFDASLRRGTAEGVARAVAADPEIARRLPDAVRHAAVTEVNRAAGREGEQRDVDAVQARTGRSVQDRNSAMKYARVYVTANVAVDIGGRVDGIVTESPNADGGPYIVESKRRVHRFLGVPEYERIQIELYMRMFGVERCLHVETLRDEQRDTWVSRSDDLVGSIVRGLRAIVPQKIVARCIPAVGARLVADPFRRSRTRRAENEQFDVADPSERLGGLWVETGRVA